MTIHSLYTACFLEPAFKSTVHALLPFPTGKGASASKGGKNRSQQLLLKGLGAEEVERARLPLAAATRCPRITLGDKTRGWHQKKESSLLLLYPTLTPSSSFFFKGGFLPSLNETLSLKDCNPRQMTSAPNLIFWQVTLTAPSFWFLRHVVRHILTCQSSSRGRIKKREKERSEHLWRWRGDKRLWHLF